MEPLKRTLLLMLATAALLSCQARPAKRPKAAPGPTSNARDETRRAIPEVAPQLPRASVGFLRRTAQRFARLLAATRATYSNETLGKLHSDKVPVEFGDRSSYPGKKRAIPHSSAFLNLLLFEAGMDGDRNYPPAEVTQGFRINYRSAFPLGVLGEPSDEIERLAVKEVAKTPNELVEWVSEQGTCFEYLAAFADIASVERCVSCHNEHPLAVKTDYKLNDVMGALVIRMRVRADLSACD